MRRFIQNRILQIYSELETEKGASSFSKPWRGGGERMVGGEKKIGIKMFWPTFARGLWPKISKVSSSETNQTANKRRRQKKLVKIFWNFMNLQKTKHVLEISRRLWKTLSQSFTQRSRVGHESTHILPAFCIFKSNSKLNFNFNDFTYSSHELSQQKSTLSSNYCTQLLQSIRPLLHN